VKKEVKKIVAIGMVVIFAIGAAFVLLPKDNSDPPIAVEPITPINPTPKPTEPVKPALMSFSKPGIAQSDIDANTATIICKMPEETQIILDMKATLTEGGWSLTKTSPQEHGLFAETDSYRIAFFGINPTKELASQLAKTHKADSGKSSVDVPAGTVLGTVGYQLENDWKLEGCNLVILIRVYSKQVDLIEPSFSSILDAITR
jgi:hypothetical protein